MSNQLLNTVQIIVGIFLVLLIIIQAKGGGLGSAFGGLGGLYRSKRGLEKIIFYLTIITSCIFFLLSGVSFVFFS